MSNADKLDILAEVCQALSILFIVIAISKALDKIALLEYDVERLKSKENNAKSVGKNVKERSQEKASE